MVEYEAYITCSHYAYGPVTPGSVSNFCVGVLVFPISCMAKCCTRVVVCNRGKGLCNGDYSMKCFVTDEGYCKLKGLNHVHRTQH